MLSNNQCSSILNALNGLNNHFGTVPTAFCIKKLVYDSTSRLVNGSCVLQSSLRPDSQICSQQKQGVPPQMLQQPAIICPRLWILTPELCYVSLVNPSALKASQCQVPSVLGGTMCFPDSWHYFLHLCSLLSCSESSPSGFREQLGSSDLSDGVAAGAGGEIRAEWAFCVISALGKHACQRVMKVDSRKSLDDVQLWLQLLG